MELFCTAGRGTEAFLYTELHDKFEEYIDKVQTTEGKVYFQIKKTCPDIQNRVLQLMTVERLFVSVMTRKISPESSTRRDLLTLMHTELNNRLLWDTAIDSLQRLKRGPPDDKDCLLKKYSTLITNSKNHSCSISSRAEEKRMDMENSKTHLKETMSDSAKRSDNELIMGPTFSSRVKRCYDEATTEANITSVVKKLCTEQDVFKFNKETLTFRVSCKFTGSIRHKLKIQMSSKQMGVLISKLMGWRTELRNPDIEICIHMNNDVMVVGIPVFRKPLARRAYIKHDGLRSTVCRIMSQLADIQTGDTVLDPMCGKGVILLEALHLCQRAMYLGMDISQDQLCFAQENIDYKPEHQSIQIVQGDCLDLPFHDNSVDKIITDAPFGQNHKTETDLQQFYLEMLSEAFRVLKAKGIMVLLTSSEIKERLYQTLQNKESSYKHTKSEFVQRNNVNNDKDMEKVHCLNECMDNSNVLFHKHIDSEQESNSDELKQHTARFEDSYNDGLDRINSSRENFKQRNSLEDLSNDSYEEQCNKQLSCHDKEDKVCGTVCNQLVETESVESNCNIYNPDKFKDCGIKAAEFPSFTCRCSSLKDKFTFVSHNYVKLGETNGYICVLLSNKNK